MELIKTYGFINWRDWYKLYELEYKKSEIEKKAEFLSNYISKDKLSAVYNSIKRDLNKLVDKMLKIYYKAFEDYVFSHMSDEDDIYLTGSYIADMFGEDFMYIYFDIQNAVNSDDTEEKIQVLNKAKNFTHNYNQHIVSLKGEPNISDLDVDYGRYVWDNNILLWTDKSINEFYDNLTSDKYHKDWDLDIEKEANLKYAANNLKEGTYRYKDIASSSAIDYLEQFILSDYIRFKLKGQINYHKLLRGMLNYKIQIIDREGSTESLLKSNGITVYTDLDIYNSNKKQKEFVQGSLLHEMMHLFQRYSGINPKPTYWEKIKKDIIQPSLFSEYTEKDNRMLESPTGYSGDSAINVQKYFTSAHEIQSVVFEIDYLMNYKGWSEEDIIDAFVYDGEYECLSKNQIEKAIEIVKSPTPQEYTRQMGQEQLFRANSKYNWYKIALKKCGQNNNIAYHGTSYNNAEKILKQGFDTYVSWEQFENYFDVFYSDLSYENQNKIEVPNSRIGSKWENAVDQLMDLWYQENPNAQIIWVTDSAEIAEDFGDVVLEVDISEMDYFFNDMGYGWSMKYKKGFIPPKKFRLLR